MILHKFKIIVFLPIYAFICGLYSSTIMHCFKKKSPKKNNRFWMLSTMMLFRVLFVKNVRLHYNPKLLSPKKTILISNHVNTIDWMVIWLSLTTLKKPNIIFYAKRSLYFYGKLIKRCSEKMIDFVFLDRDLNFDHINISYACGVINDELKKFTNVIFPEGTLLRRKKAVGINMRRCVSRNEMLFTNVLMPKTTGFKLLIEKLNDVEGIMDCTLQYRGNMSIKNFILGRRIDIDVYIDYVDIEDVKNDPENWLIQSFREKDRCLKFDDCNKDEYCVIPISTPTKTKYFFTMGIPWLSEKIKDFLNIE